MGHTPSVDKDSCGSRVVRRPLKNLGKVMVRRITKPGPGVYLNTFRITRGAIPAPAPFLGAFH